MRDPYETLGVKPSATAAEIKAAYRKLAKTLHPDINPGNKKAETQFKDITAAYDLLSDPAKRARFDRQEIDAQGQETGRANMRGQSARQAGYEDFNAEDIFADLFGQARARNNAHFSRGYTGGFSGFEENEKRAGGKGSDITYTISIPFLEACLGSKRRITLTSGKTVDITIPPGTEDQQKLRLKGHGMASPMGVAGDALLLVQVEPHAFFTRQGPHIHLECPISLPEAVLGGSIKVPTLSGQVSLKVPKGTHSGTQLRLKGKGVVDAKTNEYGDQFVKLKIILPNVIDEKLANFMEKWAKDHAYETRKSLNS